MLECAIIPGRCIGPFILGTPLSRCIHALAEQFGARTPIDMKYDKRHPPALDTAIIIKSEGVLLRFHPFSQLCHAIEVFSLDKISLLFNGEYLASPGVPPSLDRVLQLMAPPHPGKYNKEKHLYTIKYPGMVLTFGLDENAAATMESGSDTWMLPVNAAKLSPLLKRVQVVPTTDVIEVDPPLPSPTTYFEVVKADPFHGIRFDQSNVEVKFGASMQDLISKLGHPSDTQVKDDDRIGIYHNSERESGAMSDVNDYFVNYYHLGLDFLMCGHSHVVKKIVLHSNPIEHVNFAVYYPINFRLSLHLNENGKSGDQVRTVSIDSRSNADEIKAVPIMDSFLIKVDHENPFGQLRLAAVDGAAFEVMETGKIATVTLFPPRRRRGAAGRRRVSSPSAQVLSAIPEGGERTGSAGGLSAVTRGGKVDRSFSDELGRGSPSPEANRFKPKPVASEEEEELAGGGLQPHSRIEQEEGEGEEPRTSAAATGSSDSAGNGSAAAATGVSGSGNLPQSKHAAKGKKARKTAAHRV
eukprot:CAMPEP_0113896950 /NCGR_PEP_ID=MMETSP0780_2-20120614/18355_1 /TAXON_ID=652834 /ORGANISM="Palpitomonas bilix" /LENGTH=525 /DNA_ID=CAMNT_0000888253 /DNA_START=219 /DNA_END=1796 /DNA_ORIENTATION=- /assembly_acc=CAM_ASM_000599